MPIPIIAAGIGAVATGASTAAGLVGAKKARTAQERMQQESMAFQKEQAARQEQILGQQYQQSRADLEPFRQSQLGALQQAMALTDPNSQQTQMERSMATEQIQRQLAAQGLLRSGSQVRSLSDLEALLAQNRFQRINALANTGAVQQGVQLGQGYAQNLAGVYGNLGQQVGSSYQNLGQIQAQGAANQSQLLGQGLAGLSNAFQTGVEGMQRQQIQQQNAGYQQQYLDLLKGWGRSGAPILPAMGTNPLANGFQSANFGRLGGRY